MRRLALSLLRIIQRRPVSSDITDLLAWAKECRANINGTLEIGTLHVLSLACRESEGWPNGLRAGCERLAEEITRATKGDDDATVSASTLLLKAHAVADEICALGLRVNPVVEVFQHLNESICEREKQAREHGLAAEVAALREAWERLLIVARAQEARASHVHGGYLRGICEDALRARKGEGSCP